MIKLSYKGKRKFMKHLLFLSVLLVTQAGPAQSSTLNPVRFSCAVDLHLEGKQTLRVAGPSILNATIGESFESSMKFQSNDGKSTFFFSFQAKAITSPINGMMIGSHSSTTVLNPFDGTTFFHSDKTGETRFSENDSIANLVEPKLMIGSHAAFSSYNVNLISNKANKTLRFNGKAIKEIYAICQLGTEI